MPSQQSTSKAVPIHVQASAPLDADPAAGDITALLTNGAGSGALEVFIQTDTPQTITSVRLSLREDDSWAIVSQAGVGDVLFQALDLLAGRSVKFVIADAGRPTHAVLSAGYSGVLTCSVKRLES